MPSPYLTKSDFKACFDCRTKLFYRKNGYPTSIDENEYIQFLADGGFMIETVAKAQYPQLAALHDELRQIENSVGIDASPADTTTVPQSAFDLVQAMAAPTEGDIVVEINWSSCKISRPNARISERKVSDTMVSFMEELQAALGIEVLRKLTALRVSRGPLVSQNPQIDYVNSKTGAIYVNHPIGHTGFYVLTHSGTAEKVAALKEAWKFLGLLPGALTIRKT